MNFNDFRIKNRIKKIEFSDLGFGTQITSKKRFINKDGSFNIIRKGKNVVTPYQTLVEMSWLKFIWVFIIFLVGINFFFACIYVAIGVDALDGVRSSTFSQDLGNAFFFSIETFTTVGYGTISPMGFPAHFVSSMDAFAGLMSFALATGLFFARFAKPKAEILFSKKAIIAPYREITSFQFRIANLRRNKIINLEAQVVLTYLENNGSEKPNRRFKALKLERYKVFLFPLNWTIVHPIEKDSPMYGKSEEEVKKMNAEFLILVKGYDETYAQEVHSNSSYTWNEIQWNAKFKMMYHDDEEKGMILELDKIDHIEYLNADKT
jgi:inward rectifier potassium channel